MIVNIDVMLARRKMNVFALSDKMLRHARLPYSASARTELDAARYDDMPENGLQAVRGG